VGPLLKIWLSNSRKRLSVGNGKEPSLEPSLLGYSGTGVAQEGTCGPY